MRPPAQLAPKASPQPLHSPPPGAASCINLGFEAPVWLSVRSLHHRRAASHRYARARRREPYSTSLLPAGPAPHFLMEPVHSRKTRAALLAVLVAASHVAALGEGGVVDLQPGVWPITPAQRSCVLQAAGASEAWARFHATAVLLGTAVLYGDSNETTAVRNGPGIQELMQVPIANITGAFEEWALDAAEACGIPFFEPPPDQNATWGECLLAASDAGARAMLPGLQLLYPCRPACPPTPSTLHALITSHPPSYFLQMALRTGALHLTKRTSWTLQASTPPPSTQMKRRLPG